MRFAVNQAQVTNILTIAGTWGGFVFYVLDDSGVNVRKFAVSGAPFGPENWYQVTGGVLSLADFTTAMGSGTLYQVSDIDT